MMRRADRERCGELLRDTFGVSGFRPGQEAAVETLLSGRDLLTLFPTGAGKSLCYQLPALLRPGCALVISPLIALMRDQVRHLRDAGIPAAGLDSLQTPTERAAVLEAAAAGELKLLYAAPERLQTPDFRRCFARRGLSLVVVDEAHCAVQWGDSFRPAYTAIGEFIRSLPVRPPVCAMTATADAAVRRGICERLGLVRPRVLTLPLLRENLRYEVRTTLDPGREAIRMAEAHPGEKGLVFCRTRARCESLAERFRQAGLPAREYHAGMTREERTARQDAFA